MIFISLSNVGIEISLKHSSVPILKDSKMKL